MVDPATTISILGYVVHSAVVPLLVNRLDEHGIRKVSGTIAQRLNWARRPANSDLERAARKAYLQATLWLNNSCLENMGLPITPGRRWLKSVLGSDATRAHYKLRSVLVEELDEIAKRNYVVPEMPEVRGQSELLLKAGGRRADAAVDVARKALKQRLLAELTDLQLPRAFQQRLLDGWDEVGDEGQTVVVDWFDLVCSFFFQELKSDETLERTFNLNILGELPGIALDLAELRSVWEQFAGSAMPMLDRIDVSVLKVLAEVRDNRDVLEGVLRAVAEVAEHQEELASRVSSLLEGSEAPAGSAESSLRDLILTKASTSPASVDLASLVRDLREQVAFRQWQGARVALLIDRRLTDYRSHVFVGRDHELSALRTFIDTHPSGRLVVKAPPGHGKTALLAHWIHELAETPSFVAYHFFSDADPTTSTAQGAYQNILRQLRIYYQDPDPSMPVEQSEVLDKILSLVKDGRRTERLIVVLDGLDEAEDKVADMFPFPFALPDGIYLLVSGRANADEHPAYLRDWVKRADLPPLYLGALSEPDMSDWLRHAGAEFAGLAQDPDWVAQLCAKTEGEPRYSHHLIEEMLREAPMTSPRDLLDAVPTGFAEYVQQSLDNLMEIATEPELYSLNLLAVARGPLRDDEISAISRADGGPAIKRSDFIALRRRWTVSRWLHVRELEEGVEEWAFASQHEAGIFASHLGRDALAAREALVSWCSTWSQHPPQWDYALRHFAGHLLAKVPEHHEGEPEPMMTDRAALYELVDSEVFERTQLARLPAEPDLPLRTIQSAIRAAAKTDDAVSIVRYILLHKRWLAGVRQSPLEGLKRGGPRHARTLADLATSEDSVLWHLLIASSIRESDPAGASASIGVLGTRTLHPLPGWREDASALLLADLVEVEGVRTLVDRLLGETARLRFIEQVAARSQNIASKASAVASALHLALEVCRGITAPPTRIVALIKVADAMVRNGLDAEAHSTLQEADTTADLIQAESEHDEALAHLSGSWARLGRPDAAWPRADAIVNPYIRFDAYLAIGATSAGANHDDASRAAFEDARLIALAWFQWQEWSSARSSFSDLFKREVRTAAPHEARDHTASWMKEAVARTGRDGLQRLLEKSVVADPRDAVTFYLALDEAATRHGLREIGYRAVLRALDSAHKVPRAFDRALSLIKVTPALAKQGRAPAETFDAVRALLPATDSHFEQSRVLVQLAIAERTMGLIESAKSDYAAAIASASRVEDPIERTTSLLRVAVGGAGTDQQRAAFASALRSADDIGDAAKRMVYLHLIADTQLRHGGASDDSVAADLGRDAARDLPDHVTRAAHIIVMAEQEHRAGQRDRALQSLELAADAVRQAADPPEQVPLMARIAFVRSETGLEHQSVQTFAEAKRSAANVQDIVQRANLESMLVVGQLCAGQQIEAYQSAGAIEEPEVRSFSLWMVAEDALDRGWISKSSIVLDAAIESSGAIAVPADRATALVQLIDACSRGGGFTTISAADRLKQRAEYLEGLPAKVRVDKHTVDTALDIAAAELLTALTCADRGDEAGASVAFEGARSAAGGIPDVPHRSACLGFIAALADQRGYARETVRLVDDAVREASTIWSPLDRFHALANLAQVTAAAGAAGPGWQASLKEAWVECDIRLRARMLLDVPVEASEIRERLAGLQCSSQIHNDGTNPTARLITLLVVGRVQVRAGMSSAAAESFHLARSTARDIEPREERAVMLTTIDEVERMPIQQLEDAAIELGRRHRFDLLLLVAHRQMDARQIDDSVRTIADARKIIDTISDDETKARMLGKIESAATAAKEPETRVAKSPLKLSEVDTSAERSAAHSDANAVGGVDFIQTIAGELTQLPVQFDSMGWVKEAIKQERANPALHTPPHSPSQTPERERTAATRDGLRAGEQVQVNAIASNLPSTAPLEEAVLAMKAVLSDRDALVQTAQTRQAVLSVGSRHLLAAARDAADRGQREDFENFLVPCAYHPDIVPELCALVSRVYPLQADRIMETLSP